jgi:hypothetical protein
MGTDGKGARPPFDAKLKASIGKVLRAHGVPHREIDDKRHDVLLEVQKSPTVPITEPERTQYIHGVARNVGREYRMAEAARGAAVPFDEERHAIGGESPRHESIDLAQRLHADAVASDPQGADWLVRAKVHGDTETGIAQKDGVPVDRVRKRIERLVAKMRANPRALAALATLILVVTFISRWRTQPPPKEHVASPYPFAAEQKAAELRHAAFTACGAQRLAECVDDFDEALHLDPAGDASEEVQAARRAAEKALREQKGATPEQPSKP